MIWKRTKHEHRQGQETGEDDRNRTGGRGVARGCSCSGGSVNNT